MSNKILIIDDDRAFANLLSSFLGTIDKYELKIAYNIDEAIDQIDNFLPNLIITDLRLKQGREGLAIFDYLNEHHLDIPTIIITAFGDKQNLLKCIEKRPHYLFEKSQNFADLKLKVTEILMNKKKRNKPHLATVRSLLFNLPRQQHFNLLLEGIEHLTLDEYKDLEEELPLLRLSVQESTQAKDMSDKTDLEREAAGLIPISIIKKSNVYYEKQSYKSKTTGKRTVYAYFYLRWTGDDGKPAQQYLGKYEDIQDPIILDKIHERYPEFKPAKINKY